MSRYYDTFMRILFPVGDKVREQIAEKLVFGSILDVACGTGTLLEMAENKGMSCFGIDLSEGMLTQTRIKVQKAQLVRASYYELPFSAESFEVVVATNALSGVFIDAKKVLSEMIRVCRKDGRIYLGEWQKAAEDTFSIRLTVWLASLNDDAPKDYLKIFNELGYEPDFEKLSDQMFIFSIRKKS
jgi:ubiquinone/menaquinone biosynthesis C-methylase UbiE